MKTSCCRTQLLNSVQAFARELQKNEKKQEGFFYGRINLQELLYFQLPRRVHEPHEEAKELNASDGCIADHDGSNGAGAAAAAPVGAITGAAADGLRLPDDKAKDLRNVLGRLFAAGAARRIKRVTLESLIGKLTYARIAFPWLRHLINPFLRANAGGGRA